MTAELDRLRRQYAALLVWLLWAHVPVMGLAAMWNKAMPVPLAMLVAATMALAYQAAFWRWGTAPATRYVATVALIGEPALLLVLFAGHPWQMDMHMYFFAVLALNIAWFDRWPLVLGAAVTAVHHLVLLYLLPVAVFPGSGDLARVLLHAVIVIFQLIVLMWVADMVRQTFTRMNRLSGELVQKGIALEERTMEAEAANRAKSMFLANVSHEIRTPINAILGFSHLLQRNTLEPRQKDQVGKINAAGVLLLRLINDVLDFSKIEAGKLEFDDCEFDLRGAIESQLQMVSETAHGKGLRVEVRVDSKIPALLIGDDMRFNQVVLNLLSNAIKFTPEGRIVLTVDMVETKDGIASIECAVKDTGIGMTEDQQAMLFTSFAQADASTTRRFGGTGLGLAICRQIVEQMDGWIRVDSQPDRGSVFTFMVRMKVAETRAASLPRPDVVTRRLRVLIADDNPAARQIIQEIFARWGMQADLASSGSKVVDMLRVAGAAGHPYDLLMLDWKMPVVDGFETLDRIRAHSEIVRRPVTVMMTAYDIDECILQGAGKDVGAYLSKPIDATRLCSTLNQLFPSDSAEQAAEAAAALRLPDDLHGQRVLLVEDNEINREIAVELLTDAGLIVDCAENGLIACDKVARHGDNYALVLMDVQMPEMDGVTATRRIRECRDPRTLPIIAMTAHAYEEDRNRCLDAGMNDHISKPIDPPVLLRTLDRWLRKAATDRGATASGAGTEPSNVMGLPQHLPPFDIEAALTRVNGKVALLRRLIFSFAERYAGVSDQLSALLHDGQLDQAADLAHALKGVAASLGLPDIAALAGQIEDRIRSGADPDLGDLTVRLAEAVGPAVAAANSLAAPGVPDAVHDARSVPGPGASPGATASAQILDFEAAGRARDVLRDQISRHSLSARRGFQSFAEALGIAAGDRDSDPIGDAILRLDYDAALELLDRRYASLPDGRKDLSA